MTQYSNINVDLLTSKDISNFIIRKYNNNYIVGIVVSPSSFLHKNKRFRPGGLFCEEIFGLLYRCVNKDCGLIVEFNENPIFDKICKKCDKFMQFNVKRKYRFASVFLNFPVINYFYFKNFINLFKIFKIFKLNYFNKNNLFKIDNKNFFNNIFVDSLIIENKFVNFINLLYKTIKNTELLKKKLNFLNKKKSLIEIKFDKFNKILDNSNFLKKIFITLFPILPSGLRTYSFDNRKITYNSRLNYLYAGIISLNNMLLDSKKCFYNLKVILFLHFVIEVTLNFYKSKDEFNLNNNLYNKLYGKYGMFRQNLLGFRVDYSGRATILPGPSLPLNAVGLPSNMVYHRVRRKKIDVNDDIFYESSFYRHYIFDKIEFFSDILSAYPVTVNRAPTLHKMNVQSFDPVLVEGESVQFNPLLCAGYNADFDGDQMGVYALLKNSSMDEAVNMLRPIVNLHSPTTKTSVFNFSQGMLAGYYFLSNYNYFKAVNSYISTNYIDVLENIDKNILVDSPVLLRSSKFFYFSTYGRLLSQF